MRAYAISDSFGIDNLRLVERDSPRPGKGEVVMQMRACSLNYRDLRMVRGEYNPKQPLPLVPLSDGAGEIVAIGEGVTRVEVGDRVTTLFSPHRQGGRPTRATISKNLGGPLDGALQERLLLPETGVVPMPAHLTFEEAATLPCAGVTAWNALATQGDLTKGDTVLTIGTGGVSIFAIQIAKLLGMRVIATSRSAAKLERVKALGADFTIDTSATPDWSKEVRKLVGNDGVDQVIEVGGVGTLEQSIRSVRPGGQISLIGVLAGVEKPLNLTPVLMQNIRIQGVFVGDATVSADFARAVEQARLRPVVDRVFPVDAIHDALRFMESGEHFGKVALTLWQ
ncbi:MAG: NAD(P)-dependent alcohol dehydrogenase [Myxococcota bacterium]